MDDIDEVFENRFDENGRWSQPPRAADAKVEAKETREEISDCLEAAPSKQRMAFVLREVEGLSSDEICKILEAQQHQPGCDAISIAQSRPGVPRSEMGCIAPC